MIKKLTATLRIDAKYDIQSAVANAVINIIRDDPIYRSCLNCMYFNEQAELCSKYNQKPPARIIAYACPTWENQDEIPF
jgi:hypothetical protein